MSIPALGFVLHDLMDQVHQVIEEMQNAGLTLEIQAGREIALAIQGVENAYSKELKTTVDELDKVAQKTVESLSTMVQEFQAKNEDLIKDVANRVQLLVNTLPFADKRPQLLHTSPQYIVPFPGDRNVKIHCIGNFPEVGSEVEKISLVFGNREFEPVNTNIKEVSFLVPMSVLFPQKNEHNWTEGALGVVKFPWEEPNFFGLFHTHLIDSYRLLFNALPLSPGRITYVYTMPRVVQEPPVIFTSQPFYQTSASDGGNNDRKDELYELTPHSGYHVIRNTSEFNIEWDKGVWSKSFVSDDVDRVVYKVTTIHKAVSIFGAPDSGQVRFRISFQEQKEAYTVQDTHTGSFDLRWGESHTLPASTVKVIFDGFDKTHQEFIGANLENRYVKVLQHNGEWVVQTADPDSLES